MKTNRILSLVIALVLIFALVGCNDKQEEIEKEKEHLSSESSQEEEEEVVTIKIGASPSPHGEILEKAKEILKKDGIELEIIEFSDYVLPNLALEGGDILANYFQHEPYLIDFNEGNNTNLVSVALVHYEPMGLYAGKTASLEDIKEGAKIAVPNDSTNEARALLLLEANGLIKLKKDVGTEATILDIEENKLNLEIIEVEASQTPAVLPDVDFSVINSNYALQANVIDKVIVVEDENSVAVEYANVIAVHESNKDNKDILKLVEVLKSEEIKDFIKEKYGKSVIPYNG